MKHTSDLEAEYAQDHGRQQAPVNHGFSGIADPLELPPFPLSVL